ncbi:ATPase 10, plasma membrane-type-like [Asparagus officinalis]|uniref:ATPase 10, plasma membrane-type-like n=1 Tax=Asparagus officinalis TaxID=4686 RepID=UPI00098E0A8E|nr:ATPase 10, plasma membrane-type-like [Asparagus officinalis]
MKSIKYYGAYCGSGSTSACPAPYARTHFNVRSLSSSSEEMSSAVYLQVNIISQALIFVTHSQSWSFVERPGSLLICAFMGAQLKSKRLPRLLQYRWGWAGVIWLYTDILLSTGIFYFPLDLIKFAVQYGLSGEAWNLVFDRKVCVTELSFLLISSSQQFISTVHKDH